MASPPYFGDADPGWTLGVMVHSSATRDAQASTVVFRHADIISATGCRTIRASVSLNNIRGVGFSECRFGFLAGEHKPELIQRVRGSSIHLKLELGVGIYLPLPNQLFVPAWRCLSFSVHKPAVNRIDEFGICPFRPNVERSPPFLGLRFFPFVHLLRGGEGQQIGPCP